VLPFSISPENLRTSRFDFPIEQLYGTIPCRISFESILLHTLFSFSPTIFNSVSPISQPAAKFLFSVILRLVAFFALGFSLFLPFLLSPHPPPVYTPEHNDAPLGAFFPAHREFPPLPFPAFPHSFSPRMLTIDSCPPPRTESSSLSFFPIADRLSSPFPLVSPRSTVTRRAAISSNTPYRLKEPPTSCPSSLNSPFSPTFIVSWEALLHFLVYVFLR